VSLRFDRDSEDLRAALERHGSTPRLPPYIEREAGATAEDRLALSERSTPQREGAVRRRRLAALTERLFKALDAGRSGARQW